jgi:hypothetical protein
MKVANRELATRPKGTPWAGRGLVSDVAGFSFVDSSFFLFSLVLMNELAKAVIVLALATVAAVWLMSMALHLWPNTDQLAYGNPLPYLKVSFNRPVNAVRFWVEDFGGLQYERVWLYVNGRLATSGGPGTDATAKCGDEVAAVVKYHSGTKKLEGRILCTKPIKAPSGGETKLAFRLIQTAKAYRAMTGDMDQTGPPLRFDGQCNIFVNNIGEASVTIIATRPDVVFCIGTTCSTSYTFKWKDIVRSIRQIVQIDVLKAPDAPASQLLGGGRSVVDIYIDYYDSGSPGYTTLNVYVNGTNIASCYKETTVSIIPTSWTEYVPLNATGDYMFRIVGYLPYWLTNKSSYYDIVVLDTDLTLYERSDGSFGFALTTNPVANATDKDIQLDTNLLIPIRCPSGSTYYAYLAEEVFDEEYKETIWGYLNSSGPLARFRDQIEYYNETLRNALCNALDRVVDAEFNVPYIDINKTGEYLVYHTYSSRWSGSATLRFKTLSISSFGAVYANAILPIDIKLPPPAVELPQIIQSSQPNQPPNQQTLRDLLQNIQRIYITIYKG